MVDQAQIATPSDAEWEPTAEWVMANLGVSQEDAGWLLVLYRFLPSGLDAAIPRYPYFCEPL